MIFSLILFAIQLISIQGYLIPREKGSSITTYHVNNRIEIEENPKYRKILNSNQEDVIFILHETNSFLAKRINVNEDGVENLDNKVESTLWWNGVEQVDEEIEIGWVEYQPYNATNQVYPGFVPITACQSQELGSSGQIQFSYLYGAGSQIGSHRQTTLSGLILGIQSTLGHSFSLSVTVSGITYCDVPVGVVGQVLSKPTFVSVNTNERFSWWSRKLQRFVGTEEFSENQEKLILLSAANLYCITSDKVELFCDSRLGEPDWENPIGEEYNDYAIASN